MCDFFAGELHRHTSEGSKRDGYGLAEDGAKYAVELGYSALAITDHGMMSGCAKHYKACKDRNVNGILGIEGYFQITYNNEKRYFHTSLLARNNTGYENLCKMTTDASAHQFRFQKGATSSTRGYIPIFTLDDFRQYHEGVIHMSGCIGGMIPQLYVHGHEEMAKKLMYACRDIFGEDFYLEVMPNPVIENGINIQQMANEWLIKQARLNGWKTVGTTDCHYPRKEDYSSYLKMWEVSHATPSTDYSKLYMHTGEQWASAWYELMGERGERHLETTHEIAEKCNISLEFTDMKPKVDWGEPSEERLLRLTVEGLEEKGLWDWDGTTEGWRTSQYVKEAMREYNVVLKTGFTDYFLIVQDYLDFCKKRGIMYGARGSVNGFLLAFILGISRVDSIKYGTYPFRFLREDKVDVDPDIDMDVDPTRRQEVFAYLFEKYAGRSAPISNFSYWTTKALINELVKTYPTLSAKDKKDITDALIAIDYNDKPIGYDRLFEDELFGDFFVEFRSRFPDFLVHFCNLHGQLMHYGRHAGGVVITNQEAWKYLPMFRTGKDDDEESYALQTAYNMEDLTELRLMKYDILGLAEYRHIADVEAMVGCSFRDEITQDPRIYQWICELRTEAIFQSGTDLAQRMYQAIMPRNFSEVSVAISMNRPGPYSNGLLKNFIEGKYGNVDKSLPWYKICEETYGAIVYQEHAMLIAVLLAGMTWAHADKFIKGISKKKIMPELHQEFVTGLQQVSGIGEEQAQELYESIKKYSFNKNHAVGYAQITVYGMWLKINYPYEFYCAALRKKDKSKKKIDSLQVLEAAFYRDTRDPQDPGKNGLILLPHINGPANYDIVMGAGQKFLHQGLINIDGIGPKAAEDIASHGPYQEPDFEAYGNLLREKNPGISGEDIIIKAWQATLKEAGVAGRNATENSVRALLKAGALRMNKRIILSVADNYRQKLVRKHEWKWRKARQEAQKAQQKEMERKQQWEHSEDTLKQAI